MAGMAGRHKTMRPSQKEIIISPPDDMEITFNDRDSKNTSMPASKNNRYRDAIASGERNHLNASELASAFKTEHKAWKDRKDY